MPPASESRFERDTRVTPAGGDRFDARIDSGWWIVDGPNGGYVAAILLRAMELAVADPERAPRSLSIHYTARPAEGPVQIETHVERRGRSLSSVSARMTQDDRLLCLALAAFSKSREGHDFCHTPMPEVAPPDECEPLLPRIEIHRRYEHRWAIGQQPFSGGSSRALCGGWIRASEPRVADAALVTAYTDAFPPAIFSLVAEGAISGAVPTIDLTIHFRETLPLAGAAPDDFALAIFRSRQSRDGFMEEDGEIWSRDGVLLAQSRQLALVL
jgi:acyl-CoA thioesterase